MALAFRILKIYNIVRLLFAVGIWILMPTVVLLSGYTVAAERFSKIEIDLEAGTLSVEISDTPLVDVLEKIGEKAGFSLVLPLSLEDRITKKFSNVPLAQGIRRLVGNRSVAIVYQKEDVPRNRNDPQDIKEVRIFDTVGAAAGGAAPEARDEPVFTEGPAVSPDDSPAPEPNAPEAEAPPSRDVEKEVPPPSPEAGQEVSPPPSQEGEKAVPQPRVPTRVRKRPRP